MVSKQELWNEDDLARRFVFDNLVMCTRGFGQRDRFADHRVDRSATESVDDSRVDLSEFFGR